jgi:hypothetical protein
MIAVSHLPRSQHSAGVCGITSRERRHVRWGLCDALPCGLSVGPRPISPTDHLSRLEAGNLHVQWSANADGGGAVEHGLCNRSQHFDVKVQRNRGELRAKGLQRVNRALARQQSARSRNASRLACAYTSWKKFRLPTYAGILGRHGWRSPPTQPEARLGKRAKQKALCDWSGDADFVDVEKSALSRRGSQDGAKRAGQAPGRSDAVCDGSGFPSRLKVAWKWRPERPWRAHFRRSNGHH